MSGRHFVINAELISGCTSVPLHPIGLPNYSSSLTEVTNKRASSASRLAKTVEQLAADQISI
jgi:hypothetical protein